MSRGIAWCLAAGLAAAALHAVACTWTTTRPTEQAPAPTSPTTTDPSAHLPLAPPTEAADTTKLPGTPRVLIQDVVGATPDEAGAGLADALDMQHAHILTGKAQVPLEQAAVRIIAPAESGEPHHAGLHMRSSEQPLEVRAGILGQRLEHEELLAQDLGLGRGLGHAKHLGQGGPMGVLTTDLGG